MPRGEKRPADVIGNAVHVMRIATGEIEDRRGDRVMKALTTSVAILMVLTVHPMATSHAESDSISGAVRRQKMQQEERTDQIVKLTKPLFACVNKNARSSEIVSSSERADIAARAAVGLCSKEETAYRSALFQLAIVMTSFDATANAQRTHAQLVDIALTIIVKERAGHRFVPKNLD